MLVTFDPMDLDVAKVRQIEELAIEAGVSPEEVVRRLLLVGLRMYPGFASDDGFKLAMDVAVEADRRTETDP